MPGENTDATLFKLMDSTLLNGEREFVNVVYGQWFFAHRTAQFINNPNWGCSRLSASFLPSQFNRKGGEIVAYIPCKCSHSNNPISNLLENFLFIQPWEIFINVRTYACGQVVINWKQTHTNQRTVHPNQCPRGMAGLPVIIVACPHCIWLFFLSNNHYGVIRPQWTYVRMDNQNNFHTSALSHIAVVRSERQTHSIGDILYRTPGTFCTEKRTSTYSTVHVLIQTHSTTLNGKRILIIISEVL